MFPRNPEEFGKVVTTTKKTVFPPSVIAPLMPHAIACGFVAFVIGTPAKGPDIPRALALEEIDRPLEYHDSSGKVVKVEGVTNRTMMRGGDTGKFTRVFTDAQARPLYVSVCKKFVRRQSQISDEALAELWRRPIRLISKIEGGFTLARVNAGSFQNLAHLHLKISGNKRAFQKYWAGDDVYQMLAQSARGGKI